MNTSNRPNQAEKLSNPPITCFVILVCIALLMIHLLKTDLGFVDSGRKLLEIHHMLGILTHGCLLLIK